MYMTKHTIPDIDKDFSEWYNWIVYEAKLADLAPVKGCMVIRPYGYALWENIKNILDEKIKRTGHQNAAFPLLIPESFLKREADHVAGFSPELAVVTHAGGKELEEPLVVRPTSETIIHYMFARWIRSWRDLPLKINQWASVVRWEMRTRPFLRTTEFWWQEGHTAHETAIEAHEEVMRMLEEYRDLAENYLAIPVVVGQKTAQEKFAGADLTMTFEGLMRDGKALQMGTSHAISQNFARAFDMKFQDRNGGLAYPYLTSWGATTRLIGALVMTHGDERGLIMPPKVAPYQILIVPIYKSGDQHEIKRAAIALSEQLSTHFRVELDLDEQATPGTKFYRGEVQGIPLRIELGSRDLANKSVIVVNRLTKAKESCPIESINSYCHSQLEFMQQQLFERAKVRRASQWYHVDTYAQLAEQIAINRGFYQINWCGNNECETQLKQVQASIRCVLTHEQAHGPCFCCGKPSTQVVLAAQSY